jgi:hypothetical protein
MNPKPSISIRATDVRARSVDSLRQMLHTAALSHPAIPHAKQGGAAGPAGDVWIEDILTPESGEGWRAVIRAGDARLYEVPFTLEAGVVKLAEKAREVIRSTSYVEVTARQAPEKKPDLPGSDAPAIRARIATEVSDMARPIMFMPGGVHTITPGAGDGSAEITVKIDEHTADVLNASLEAINYALSPQRVFIDKEHEGKEATAWPEEFFWSNTPQPGVYARVELSELGKQLIGGRIIRAFSPSFRTDAALPKAIRKGQFITIAAGKRGSPENPARVTGLAAPDIGTFTNNPAFKSILPLFARQARASAASAAAVAAGAQS